MVAGRDSAGRLLGDCGLDEYRAGGIRPRRAQHRGAEGHRARQEADRSRRPRRHLCGGRLLGRGPPQRGGVGAGRPGRAAGQRRNPARSGSQAVRLVGRARRRQGDVGWQFAVAGQQEQAAGNGPRRSRRGRGRRPDESGARRAAAIRRGGGAAGRSDRKTEGRQDHAFRHQGQPDRHGARAWRPGSDRGRARKICRRAFPSPPTTSRRRLISFRPTRIRSR